MKHKDEILTGVVIGGVIGVLYNTQLAPYLPLLVIVGVVLFARLLPR
jgi:hypothetical protein